MQIPEYYNPVARDIALALIAGFNKHYRLFRECNRNAKTLFENADWHGVQKAIRDRIQFYDQRVSETVTLLHRDFHGDRTPEGPRNTSLPDEGYARSCHAGKPR